MSFIQMGYMGGPRAEAAMQRRAENTLNYAEKWAPVFGAPLSWLMALAEMESSHIPTKVNMAARHKGGAWGLLQQMADEVPYKLKVIKRFYGRRGKPHAARVQQTLRKWKGNPKALLDPDLNVMLAAWQLGRLNRVFDGNFANAFAAYHQGEYAVKRRLKQGLPSVDPRKQPKGYAYVNEAAHARMKYIPMLIARLEERLATQWTPYLAMD